MPLTNRIIAIDVSSSMSESVGARTKLEWVSRAVRDSLPTFSPGHVGAVAFGSAASVLVPLQHSLLARRSVPAAVRAASPSGCTAMAAGLSLAIDQLAARPREYARRVVLCSDGQPTDSPDELERQLERAAREKVAVDTIGFGVGAQIARPLLKRIAERTGGAYAYAREVALLTSALRAMGR